MGEHPFPIRSVRRDDLFLPPALTTAETADVRDCRFEPVVERDGGDVPPGRLIFPRRPSAMNEYRLFGPASAPARPSFCKLSPIEG